MPLVGPGRGRRADSPTQSRGGCPGPLPAEHILCIWLREELERVVELATAIVRQLER